MFIFALVVVGRGQSAAGSLGLSIAMLPLVARATEEVLRLAPHLREGGMALGAPGRTVMTVIPTAAGGS